MGQQQLLLIILGVIIVGIAIAVSVVMFRDNGVSANRDALRTDLTLLASKAKIYYRRPVSMGGGGRSFANLTADLSPGGAGMLLLVNREFSDRNANGNYLIIFSNADSIVFQGIGNILMDDGINRPTVNCSVTASGQPIMTTIH